MSYAPFDIVVVPFPYSDRLAEKRRPALVISDSRLETASGLLWVAMVTSASRPVSFGDVRLGDIAAAGLPAPSTVRTGKIATIEPHRILRRAGALALADQTAVTTALRACSAF